MSAAADTPVVEDSASAEVEPAPEPAPLVQDGAPLPPPAGAVPVLSEPRPARAPVPLVDTPRYRALVEEIERRGIDVEGAEIPAGETTEDRAERLARQAAGRERAWRDSAGVYASASFALLHAQQDTDARTGKPGAVTSWLADGAARTLLLTGPSRRGKTYAAYALGNAAVARGMWVVAFRMARLNALLRADDKGAVGRVQDVLDRVPLLILDDLGSEHTTDWTGERLQDLLDERLSRQDVRNVFTTNLAWQQEHAEDGTAGPLGMVERYGERIAMRLVEGARIVKIDGQVLAAPAPW